MTELGDERTLTEADLLDAIEECFDRGWTDGLPVVPPVPALVERFLEHTTRDRDSIVWRWVQVERSCTVQAAAICAAMAGCRPEYFPVVLAALEATVDEGWPGAGAWQSTTGGGPLLIVNGPVRERLGFNAKGNVFGPGFRANATVGRAIRLIILNVYGVRPHELDQSTQGTSGKFSMCIAENEEESPWDPLHVELGHAPDESVVSAVHVRSGEFIDNRNTGDPRHVLNDIADTIGRPGAMSRRRKRVVLVLGPEHAQLLAANGYTKQDVKEYLAAHTGRTAGEFRRMGKDGFIGVTSADAKAGFEDAVMPEDQMVPRDEIPDAHRILTLSPDDVLIAVSGAMNAGVSTVAQPLGIARRLPGRAVVDE